MNKTEKNFSSYVLTNLGVGRQYQDKQIKYKCQMVVSAIKKHKSGKRGRGCRDWKIWLREVSNVHGLTREGLPGKVTFK